MTIEEFISEITGQRFCGKKALEIISRTSHMVRSRSVALGAGYCVFAARLAEAIGAVVDFSSVIPGKGILTHQILALALPSIFYSSNKDSFLEGLLPVSTIKTYVEEAFNTLVDSGIVNVESLSSRGDENIIDKSINNAVKMIHILSRIMPEISRKMRFDKRSLRVYTELLLYSYKFHIVGVIDALIEDPLSKRALIIEWKTGKTPREWEIAQAYIYALLEAERLGYDDPVAAVRDREDIIPLVIRPEGDIRVYSISDKYKTASRSIDKNSLIWKILLSAEHLVLTITNYKNYIDKNTDKLCSLKGLHGQKVSAFRKAPRGLPRSNPFKYGDKYPCRRCKYRDACEFYMKIYEDWTPLDRLSYRARYAIYEIRENALRPIKELYDLFMANGGEIDKLYEAIMKLENVLGESGNRVDYFEKATIHEKSYEIILERKIRPYEEGYEPIKLRTLREGKPVLIIFNDEFVTNPLLRLGFHGRVEEIEVKNTRKGDMVFIHVIAPNIASRLHLLILSRILKNNQRSLDKPIGLEINVDLTQMELQAIDAFHRGSRKHAELKEIVKKRLNKYNDAFFAVLFVGELLKEEEE